MTNYYRINLIKDDFLEYNKKIINLRTMLNSEDKELFDWILNNSFQPELYLESFYALMMKDIKELYYMLSDLIESKYSGKLRFVLFNTYPVILINYHKNHFLYNHFSVQVRNKDNVIIPLSGFNEFVSLMNMNEFEKIKYGFNLTSSIKGIEFAIETYNRFNKNLKDLKDGQGEEIL